LYWGSAASVARFVQRGVGAGAIQGFGLVLHFFPEEGVVEVPLHGLLLVDLEEHGVVARAQQAALRSI
jgi:hypothetical protein